METRSFRSIGKPISLLGFGCMRLPRREGKEIDRKAACNMIDFALEHGVNYFDTAWGYHEGQSEIFVGEALSARHDRSRFSLASKMPTWDLVRSLDDAQRIFTEQRKRCKVEYFDFYLMHSLNQANYDNMQKIGLYDFLLQKKRAGQIGKLGFSFHDTPDVLERIVSDHAWDFAQIQLNYLDWHDIDAKRMYTFLTQKGIPVVVMEPVRGGALASFQDEAAEVFERFQSHSSPASYALRFAASLPNVMTVLSGMSNLEQVQDNIDTFCNFHPLSDEEYRLLDEIAAIYRSFGKVPCTGCRYCMDCPSGVEIPGVFECYNRYCATKSYAAFEGEYRALPENGRADACIQCGKCAAHCPQSIDIPERMKRIAAFARQS